MLVFPRGCYTSKGDKGRSDGGSQEALHHTRRRRVGPRGNRAGDAIIALFTMIGAMTLARVDHPADPDRDGEDLSGAAF